MEEIKAKWVFEQGGFAKAVMGFGEQWNQKPT